MKTNLKLIFAASILLILLIGIVSAEEPKTPVTIEDVDKAASNPYTEGAFALIFDKDLSKLNEVIKVLSDTEKDNFFKNLIERASWDSSNKILSNLNDDYLKEFLSKFPVKDWTLSKYWSIKDKDSKFLSDENKKKLLKVISEEKDEKLRTKYFKELWEGFDYTKGDTKNGVLDPSEQPDLKKQRENLIALLNDKELTSAKDRFIEAIGGMKEKKVDLKGAELVLAGDGKTISIKDGPELPISKTLVSIMVEGDKVDFGFKLEGNDQEKHVIVPKNVKSKIDNAYHLWVNGKDFGGIMHGHGTTKTTTTLTKDGDNFKLTLNNGGPVDNNPGAAKYNNAWLQKDNVLYGVPQDGTAVDLTIDKEGNVISAPNAGIIVAKSEYSKKLSDMYIAKDKTAADQIYNDYFAKMQGANPAVEARRVYMENGNNALKFVYGVDGTGSNFMSVKESANGVDVSVNGVNGNGFVLSKIPGVNINTINVNGFKNFEVAGYVNAQDRPNALIIDNNNIFAPVQVVQSSSPTSGMVQLPYQGGVFGFFINPDDNAANPRQKQIVESIKIAAQQQVQQQQLQIQPDDEQGGGCAGGTCGVPPGVTPTQVTADAQGAGVKDSNGFIYTPPGTATVNTNPPGKDCTPGTSGCGSDGKCGPGGCGPKPGQPGYINNGKITLISNGNAIPLNLANSNYNSDPVVQKAIATAPAGSTIMVSATWCVPCQGYKSGSSLQEGYNQNSNIFLVTTSGKNLGGIQSFPTLFKKS